MDGLYSGNASLGNTQSPFIELVTHNESSNGNQNNAVRWWGAQNNNDSYEVCFDIDGAPFGPTGSAEVGNTELLPLQTFSIQLPPSSTPVTERPEIVRLDTGEPVEFVRAEFDFEEDFVGVAGNCWQYEWSEQSGTYLQSFKPEGASIVYSFPYAYRGGDTVLGRTAPDDFEQQTTAFGINNFMAHTLRDASFIEIDGRGFNTWGSSPLTFYRCHLGSQNFAPNRILLTPETMPAENENSVPLESNNCDYTDANDFDGWGYDSVLMVSCPPMANDASTNGTTDGSNSADDIPVNEAPDNEQSTPDTENNLPDDSTDNSDAVMEAENENNTDEIEGTDSNIQNDSTSTSLNLPDEIASQNDASGGGGSFWLPTLILALVLRRSKLVIQK